MEKREKLEIIKNNLELNFTKSKELYSKCLDEDQENVIILEPSEWLYNQDTMRAIWEKYKNNTSSPFYTGSYRKYFSFMYNSYPDGFGRIMSEKLSENLSIDGAEIYYELTENVVLNINKCFSCFKVVENIKSCAKCHLANYCSKECQNRDWKIHKLSCSDVASKNTDEYIGIIGEKIDKLEV